MLDAARIDWLRGLLAEGPLPLFATVSGAHLYGFASPDSDWDLRGAYVAPLRSVIGLAVADETFELSCVRDGEELDWVAHDVRKFESLGWKQTIRLEDGLASAGGRWAGGDRGSARSPQCPQQQLPPGLDVPQPGMLAGVQASLDTHNRSIRASASACMRARVAGPSSFVSAAAKPAATAWRSASPRQASAIGKSTWSSLPMCSCSSAT